MCPFSSYFQKLSLCFRNNCLILAFYACAIAGLIQSSDSLPSLGYQLQPEWRAIVCPWTWLPQFACSLIPILFYCAAVLYILSWKKSQPNSGVSRSMQSCKNMPKSEVIVWAQRLWKQSAEKMKTYTESIFPSCCCILFTLSSSNSNPIHEQSNTYLSAWWLPIRGKLKTSNCNKENSHIRICFSGRIKVFCKMSKRCQRKAYMLYEEKKYVVSSISYS